MPVTAINATAGAASANSYITETDATQYFTDRLYADAWNAASSDERKAALLWATRVLDSRVDWHGVRATAAQSLDWPRAYVKDMDAALIPPSDPNYPGYTYLDGTIVPAAIKHAQCELALALLGGDITLDPGTQGFTSIAVGPISLGVDKNDKPQSLPRAVRELLVGFGEPRNEKSSRVVKLRRT